MASGRSFGKRQVGQQPDGKARLSQVVGTYGPGAMIDLLDHAVLIGGLEFWQYDKKRGVPILAEPRLRDAVAEQLRFLDRELAQDDAFREPPTGDEKEPSKFAGVAVLEFPQWFVCQNADCRALMKSSQLELKSGKYIHGCSRTKTTECVPVRFVSACPRGHLDEFPWAWFAHRDRERCGAPSLRLVEGATGDFSEVVVRCACGAWAPLSAAQVADANPTCGGRRPWLGPEGDESCDERQRLLVRTASSSYFAQVVSALSVPEQGRELEDIVHKHWKLLKKATAANLPTIRELDDELALALARYDDAAVLRVVEAVREERTLPREPLRTAELKQFLAQKAESPGDLPSSTDSFFARRATPVGGLPTGVSALVLAHKLRELRVQVGFTRLEAVTADLQGEYDLQVRTAPLSQTAKWLPASEIRGEGMLLVLDEAAVVAWERRAVVGARGRELLAGYDDWAQTVPGAPPFPGIRFYLLHSLSHLLLSAISLECGYAASALRERIYCAAADAPAPMAAILISTGTPGSEGTLGGLVEQGRRVRTHLRRAYDLGVLCSNDPVCGTHSPAEDPGERYLEGAACHGCLFIAECACERFNRYLDRALVVPTIGHPAELAYFSERP
ncbi:MAG: DrmB family protein [Kofleriaceae bacterium]